MNAHSRFVDDELAALEAQGLLRDVAAVEPEDAAHVVIEGRRIANFASNDYLGLSADPTIRDAVARAVRDHGLGPRGSALICGHTTHHAALEETFATFVDQPAAVLTPTGYAANLAVLDALADESLHIFSDALDHASIVDGCHRAKRRGARVDVYQHADVDDLAARLEASDRPRKLVVTETVFSMDGDVAPLAEIAALRARFDFTLMTDEGHATLVFGARGAGVAEQLGVKVDIHVATASKALASVGGFVACDTATARLVRNRARAYVFSTALPLPIVAGIRAALTMDTSAHRARLWQNTQRFASHRGAEPTSPIFPIVLGDATLPTKAALRDAGFLVAGVRPPTVPAGTSRLRLTMSAAHEDETIDALARALPR